jgi:hypothetical protein
MSIQMILPWMSERHLLQSSHAVYGASWAGNIREDNSLKTKNMVCESNINMMARVSS